MANREVAAVVLDRPVAVVVVAAVVVVVAAVAVAVVLLDRPAVAAVQCVTFF